VVLEEGDGRVAARGGGQRARNLGAGGISGVHDAARGMAALACEMEVAALVLREACAYANKLKDSLCSLATDDVDGPAHVLDVGEARREVIAQLELA
jgi:hypothetical protein